MNALDMKFRIQGPVEFLIQASAESLKSFPSLRGAGTGKAIDLRTKLTAIHHFASNQPHITSYAEPFAGLGFSAGVVRLLNPQSMRFLNDNNPDCISDLCANDPCPQIRRGDAEEWDMPSCDIMFFDPSHFTLNKDTSLLIRLQKRCRTLWYTDVFPFSLKPFDEKALCVYLNRTSAFWRTRGRHMRRVFVAPSRHVMYLECPAGPRSRTNEIILAYEADLKFTIQRVVGFGL